MTTDLLRDRTPYSCEIVIPIVVKILVYIEPVVLEVPPTCDLPSQEVASLPESTTVPSAPEPQASANVLSIKALWLVLLASASAVLVYVLTNLSLAKFCPNLSCLRTNSALERFIVLLPVQPDELSDRWQQ
ncbi:MAG: hypothetical protein HC866_06890 [Leptolyngbyaceae cyanobacterium RU_5_1]|nr:hypothetical protein [Leptolyngbyaceae cyanobacterium RU_5_1]